jgi:hypothetical protein
VVVRGIHFGRVVRFGGIGHQQPPARSQHPVSLRNELRHGEGMVSRQAANHAVKALWREGKRFSRPRLKDQVGKPGRP